MKKNYLLFLIVLVPLFVNGQNIDSLMALGQYPVIEGHKYAGVIPVDGIDEFPDPDLQYKIVINATGHSKDSTKVNWVLYNIGRYYNLHVAAGIPKENVEIIVAVHAWAADSFLKNEAYKQEFETDNPNLELITELHDQGVKFLICGQSIVLAGQSKDMLVPEARLTLTAQTTLTSYQMKGYALLEMHDQN